MCNSHLVRMLRGKKMAWSDFSTLHCCLYGEQSTSAARYVQGTVVESKIGVDKRQCYGCDFAVYLP